MYFGYYGICIDFKIVIIISAEDQARNHVASRMSSYIRKLPRLPPDNDVIKYVFDHIVNEFKVPFKPASAQERYYKYTE